VASVVLTGSADLLGTRVRALLEAGGAVLALDDLELTSPDLKRSLEGATTVVHLAEDLVGTRALLEACSSVGVSTFVLLSSATVYGAWSNNPVPLTEDATVRPNPGLTFASDAAERERLVGEWRLRHPDATAAVLRPAVPVVEEGSGWLSRALRATARIRCDRDDPPGQFLHLDDLAGAIDLARRSRLDGAYNVAPDGWITGEDLRALTGGPPVRLPERLANRLARWRCRLGLGSAPNGIAPYARLSWVVANDRLRAAGWSATHTNEEAFVAGHRPAPWSLISPRRRQELALGAMVVAGLAVVAGAGVGLRRWTRRVRAQRALSALARKFDHVSAGPDQAAAW